MSKIASALLNQVGDFAKANPKTIAAILAGGGLAGVAGGMASAGNHDPRESRGSRRLRILRNALLSGAAGAGAVGAGALAHNRLANALPQGDVDPATGVFESIAGRGLMGGSLGFIGHQAGRGRRENAAAGLLHGSGINDASKGSARDTIISILRDKGQGSTDNENLYARLTGSPGRLRQGLIDAGIDGESLGAVPPNSYRLSDRFGRLGKQWQSLSDTAGSKMMEAAKDHPSLAKGLEEAGNARRTFSRAAYRQPGTAGLVAAGLMAPEVLSAVGTLAGPVTPNIFHR